MTDSNNTGPISVGALPPIPPHPWMTNGLLGMLVVLFGSGGVYTVGANNDLQDEVQAMRSSIANIAVHQENDKEWRGHHESRPHDKSADAFDALRDDSRSLDARVVALELAIENLDRRLREERRQPSEGRRR